MAGKSTAMRLAEAEAEARRWQERATAFQAELACFRDQVDYQDPETGVGSTRQFEVEFIKQVARFRRRGEGFSVVLLQVRDPEHPDEMLDTPVIVAAAHRLAETARVEDSLCRVARRGFAVLLTGADRGGADVFIHRAQQRFDDAPVIVAGKRIPLAVTGGVAVYDSTMTEVQEILTAAARDLHARPFRSNAEPAPIRPSAEREPIPLRRAS